MNYFIPSVFALAWVFICVLLLLMPTTLVETSILAIALIILHKDTGKNLENRSGLNETNIVEAGTGLVIMAISFCFIIYSLIKHYEII